MTLRFGWPHTVQVLGIGPRMDSARSGAFPNPVPFHRGADLAASGTIARLLAQGEEEAVTRNAFTKCVDADSIKTQDEKGVEHLLKRLLVRIPARNEAAGLGIKQVASDFQPRAFVYLVDNIVQSKTALSSRLAELPQRPAKARQDVLDLRERTDAKRGLFRYRGSADQLAPKRSKNDAAPRSLRRLSVGVVRDHSQWKRQTFGRQ